MKIAFLTGHLSNGGAERVIANLSNFLPESIHRQLILYEKKMDYDFNGKVEILNIYRSKSFSRKVISLIRRVYELKKIKKSGEFSIVISFLENPNLVNLLSRNKEKVIVSVRNNLSISYDKKGLAGAMYKRYISNFYKKSDFIISLSKGVSDDLVQNHNIEEEKIKTLYNPFDVNFILEQSKLSLPQRLVTLYNFPVFVCMGRINRQKGYYSLLKIFFKLNRKNPSLKLVILGRGELLGSLIEFAKNIGLKTFLDSNDEEIDVSNNVFFLGFQKNPYPLIRNSKAFLFPSLWEGYGNALAEAVIAGAIAFAADCDFGPREIIAPGSEYHEMNSVEIGKFGVLLPSLYGSQVSLLTADLSMEETMWVDSLEKFLNCNLLKEWSSPTRKDMYKFDKENIMPHWINFIERVIK